MKKQRGFVIETAVVWIVAAFFGAAVVANTATCANKASAPASCPK